MAKASGRWLMYKVCSEKEMRNFSVLYVVGINCSTSAHLANCYSKSLNFLCGLGTETCSNLKLSNIRHSRIVVSVYQRNISWQQPTLDRKKRWQKEPFPPYPPVWMQLAELWGRKSKMKFLYFWFGFGVVLGSFLFLWKIIVLFGLEDWWENCLDPDMTGERNSDCKWNLESNKIHPHNVHNFSSKKHSETDKMDVPDAMS